MKEKYLMSNKSKINLINSHDTIILFYVFLSMITYCALSRFNSPL